MIESLAKKWQILTLKSHDFYDYESSADWFRKWEKIKKNEI